MSRLLDFGAVLLVILGSFPYVCSAQSDERQASALLSEARTLVEKAASRKDLEQAAAKYQEALRICQRVGSEECIGHISNQLGVIHHKLGQNQRALEEYEKALEIQRRIGDTKQERFTLNNIGMVYKYFGQYDRALEHIEKSLLLDQKIGDRKHEAITLNNIGGLYRSWGQYPKALEYFQKELAIWNELGDEQEQAKTLNNIARVYESRGQYSKALEYFNKDLAISRKLGDLTGEGLTLNNVGGVYRSLGQYINALEHFEKSLTIAQKLGDLKGARLNLKNIAGLYKRRGEYPMALEYYEKILAMQKEAGVPYDGTEDFIGNVYLSMGDIQQAELLLKKADRWVSLGRLALAKLDFNEARLQYEKLLKGWSKKHNVRGMFVAHTGLGLAYEGLRELDQAAEHFRQAIALTEEVRNSLAPAQSANFYDVQIWDVPRITPYEGLSRVLLQSRKGEQALIEAAESIKARTFAESLCVRSEDVTPNVPHAVIVRDNEINNALAAMLRGLQEAHDEGNKEAIESFEKQVKELRVQRDAHIKGLRLRVDFPLFAATKYPQALDLEHAAIKADEWVVEYQVTETGIATFLLHGKKLVKAFFKPFARKDLEALVRKFRDPLKVIPGKDNYADKLKSFDFSSGKKLTDLLLGDIVRDLPNGGVLIIIPDGCLSVLPFEMLVLNSGGEIKTDKKLPYVNGAEFLGDRNPISYYQSVTALTVARTFQKHGKSADRLFVMADPVFQPKDQQAENATPTQVAEGDKKFFSELMASMEDPNGEGLRFNRLPLTSELATSLKELFEGQADCYIGVDATKETLLKTLAPKMGRYGTIVLATHGYFNKNNPGLLEPILALTMVPPGTDGFLRMSEVMGLKLNADVVALTACQTGLGRNISGEGTMGMGRAFQYAGAKSVLMSLWNVEQKVSGQLVDSFFKHRKAGKNKLEALKLARQEIRDAGYDHPFFWAPFILVGETD